MGCRKISKTRFLTLIQSTKPHPRIPTLYSKMSSILYNIIVFLPLKYLSSVIKLCKNNALKIIIINEFK